MNCYSGIETMPVTRLKYIPLNQKHSFRNQKMSYGKCGKALYYKDNKAVSPIQNSIEVKRELNLFIYI